MQDVSIVQNIKRLVNGFVEHRIRSNLRTVSSFYDHLLNFKNLSVPTVSTTGTIICHLRLILDQSDVADRLEKLIDEAEIKAKNVGDVQNVIYFLCCLNNIAIVPVENQHFFESNLQPLMSIESTFKSHQLKLENVLVSERLRFDATLNTNDFPLLPNSNRPKDIDEGFEEGGGGSPARLLLNNNNNAVGLFLEPKLCPKPNKNRSVRSIWEHENVLSEIFFSFETKIFLSEAGDDVFHEFYLRNYLRPLDTIVRLTNEENCSNVNEFRFNYFKRNMRNLLLGVESDLFPFDETAKSFRLRPQSCLIGVSIELLASELIPCIDAGNKFFSILSSLDLSYGEFSPILRSFYCSVRSEMNSLQTRVDNICFDACGVLQLLENLKPICETLSCVHSLVQSLEKKLINDDSAVVWLIEMLFDLCTCFNFSSHNLLFKRIFGHIFLIYLSYIENWISFGRCEQNNKHIFVLANENYLFCRDPKLWKLSFHLVDERIPSFMKSLASQIFNAGKLTCLINSCSTNAQEVSSVISCFPKKEQFKFHLLDQNCFDSDEFPAFNLDVCDSSFTFESFLNDIITPKVRTVQEKATKFLLVDCKLLDTFNVLRQMYLGANGFFTTSMTEILFPLFQNVITTETTNGLFCPLLLSRALDQCIESSSLNQDLITNFSFVFCEFEKSLNLNNINFFDSLELHCEIPWPCNLIVTDSVLVWLKKLFRFLIALRWTIWCLNDVWNYLKSSESNGCFMNKLMLCQREMKHFVQQLEIYVLHQTVDVCWCEFNRNFDSAKDFDSIFESHKNYITAIVTRCLLNPKARPVYDTIRRLLECILNFRCRLIIDENEKKAFDVYEEFKTRSKVFIEVINKLASRGYQPHLAELLLRLNFNEHYFKFS